MAMNRTQLIDAIDREMERVWGDDDDLPSEPEHYEWLEEHYGITEDEDVQWQLILDYESNDMAEEDLEDDELMDFLEDNLGVILFLERLLRKYQSGTAVYPRTG
jgi:predicted 3-demethylubiquinone-9 3-methyltransferase (glyoxalase superfamily)